MSKSLAQAHASPTPHEPFLIAGKDLRCFYRAFVLCAFATGLIALFWFGSRYPSLFHKAQSLGHHEVTSFIWTEQIVPLGAHPTFFNRVIASIANWLWSMRIGMPYPHRM